MYERRADGAWWSSAYGPVAVYQCCRDWPVAVLAPLGRCGLCGERPVRTDKTMDEYTAEREAASA